MTPATTMAEKSQSAGTTSGAPTQFIKTRLETYAYRRFGGGSAPPLVCLQHFTGTLDNWTLPSPIRWPRAERSSCSRAPG
jgi:pimeloyl-ACP methyl ester carboxylesterase